MSARLRLLFVTHVVSLGGATRSLRELINAYENADADLAVPRFAGAPDDAEIRRLFGPRLGRIHRFWLPWAEVYAGHPAVWQSARSHLLFPWMWRAQRRSFERFAAREKYDAVHLNSLVLSPMISERLPYTLHVREILTDDQERVRRLAARARAVVFIDEATRAPFAAAPLRNSIVLNNPVDMTRVGTPPENLAERLGAPLEELTVVAMIGDLTDEKGLPFVIESFRRVAAPQLRLLLVGRATPAAQSRLRELAAADRRIVFWGPEPDIEPIYTIADYVVRGEAYACVGRTIYEALYAGCSVLIPGDRESNALFEYQRFAPRAHFYPPRDAAAFAAAVASFAGKKRAAQPGESNVQRYVAELDRFLRDALGRA